MKKVLQISNYMYPNIGGIEQVARDISNSLYGKYEQKIICFNEDAQAENWVNNRAETVTEIVDDVEVIRCGCQTKIASQSLSLSYKSQLKKVMDSFVPDIVVLHYPNPFVSALLKPYLKRDFKFIVYWHLDITKQKYLGKLFNIQTRNLLKRADLVVATSPNYIEGSPFLRVVKDKCRVIPNCIDTDRLTVSDNISKRIEEIKNQNKDKIICFTCGRHVPYKGIEYLVKASKLLDNRFAVYIGGKGPLTESLKNMAVDDDKVHFLGRVSDEDLIAYMNACDVYCFPSITKNEAFGIALAEAMYFGKPAVTFTIPGSGVNYVNLSGVTGIEVSNRDVEKYAEAIVKLGNDSELRYNYGIRAKDRVIGQFLKCTFKNLIVSVLESIQ